MNTIKVKNQEMNGLIPRYKRIGSELSNLAFEVNQMINRLEPALMTAMDVDLRLCSTLRQLQNCEEQTGTLITQINLAIERFEASDRRVVSMSNELIYEFKQILHQIKNKTARVTAISPAMIEDKQTLEKLFDAKGHIDSVKLGYIAEVSGIKKDKENDKNGV